ncbi:TonB-dependent receptor [Sphingomonas oleivorans]|uniref:TonB-dependent receptor n=1 Tax=Sphingomonas oleivorans TaxID=1735121 RepID=A0A2T5G0S1_9SPHN|nr:TonB-dependent receptor [Sphingomonas oleivorans]PTQ12734.1 TonB-dependent receptor [Sphingomonas oleivorans]
MNNYSLLLKAATLAAISSSALAWSGCALAQAAAPAPAATAGTPAEAEDEIIVTGVARKDGLRKLDASFSISTASEEMIRETQPTSTADLLKIVPGVWVESSSGTAGANVFIRGFPSGGDAPYLTIQMNGSPIFPPPTLSFLENSSLFRLDDTVERVEVLRGGPSPIFSNGQPGATTNFILKKGTSTPQGSIRATLGSEGLYRGDFVVSGPVAENTTFMIGGFYRTSDGLRDTQFPADRGGQVTGSLTQKFDNGEVTVYARRLDDKNAFYTGIPLISNNGKISAYPGFDPGNDTLIGNEIRRVSIEVAPGATPVTKALDLGEGRGAKITTLGATFDFEFDAFQLSNKMNYLKGDANTRGLFTGGNPTSLTSYIASQVTAANRNAAVLAAAGRPATGGSATFVNGSGTVAGSQAVLEAGIWSVDKQLESFTDELRLSREIFSGNNLTIGGYFADYSSRDLWYLGNNVLLTVEPNARLVNVGLNNGVAVSRSGFVGSPFFDVNASYNGRNTALFLSDEWKVTPTLRVDAGARWERQKVDATLENNTTGVDLDGNPLTLYNNSAAILNGTYRTIEYAKSKISWTAGATYSITDRLNVFARANSGFAFPQFDNLRDGQFNVQTVKQYELGVKTSTRFYDLFLTGFYNRFKGLPFQQFVQNPDGTQTNLTRIGGSRAYGLEFEGAIRPITGFELATRGVVQDGKFKDFGENSGNRVSRQPKFLIALLPSYEFSTGLGEARLFGTFTHVGKRFSDVENQQALGSYETVDVGASLDIDDHLSFQATVENVFDKLALTEGNARIIGGAASGGTFLGRPIFGRHATLTAAYKF